ncbi:FecR family protein [Paraburkholderia caballeronis]|uniref:Uncharacterized conserved protein, contains LysM and FecR domains n=1 Tax=Paraburkholderia caballeronis TaxID=416943 RepID=A0A1H7VYR3_9BURK|nr:FecR domain-containing protein [Paraburkholderia caballeronis]PXW14618.1 FecR family protein [Paraburkholderia caballeronis]PXW93446.1 FecR family protein [Paraburkholderia caballeronis]RAJ88305.1 FecR family protein [Paraburkholderia caballeronis]SEE21314.1 FecR family protein [Paraburkholderia caballeronis]SEM13925.1 Uncharacterized conserved protein, contains LysM and FecR domains [Paraburkholderia caballeronis]
MTALRVTRPFADAFGLRASSLGLWFVASAVAFAAGAADAREPAARVAPPKPATVTYVTSKGDTLYDIAARYLRNPADWARLAQINRVDAPRRLPAGVKLLLPVALLRQDMPGANVLATSGPAQHAFRDGPYLPLIEGTQLVEGDRVRTGSEGFVTLELTDGSHLMIPPDTELDLSTLRQTVLTGTTDRVVSLRRGRVESEVTHATKKDDRFQIRSPSVVAGVRGTRFRVNYDRDSGSTAVEVIEGAVGVDASSQAPAAGVPLRASTQLVAANYGSVTARGGAIGAPVPLLAAPTLLNASKVQDGDDVAFDAAPVEGARGYRALIGRDAGLLDTIRDVRTDGPHIPVGALDDGTYFVRVTAISADGLEGMPGTYAFERRHMGIGASGGPADGVHSYQFRWFVDRRAESTSFRFVLAANPDLRTPLVDRPDVGGGHVVVSNLPAGVYYWSVVAGQFDRGRYYEKATPVQSFRLDR